MKVHSIDLAFHIWNELTILWNDLTWNDLTMKRNDRNHTSFELAHDAYVSMCFPLSAPSY